MLVMFLVIAENLESGHSSGTLLAKTRSVPVSRRVKARPRMSAWKNFLESQYSDRLQFLISSHKAPICVFVYLKKVHD